MELHLSNPELEARIDRWVSETGRPANELVEDALNGYLAELANIREMLDTRYEDIAGGKVQLIDGKEAFSRLRKQTEVQPDHNA
jgi:hypothetical protein